MKIKRGLKKCVDEMRIPKADSVLPEGVSAAEPDVKKSSRKRYVSFACAGVAAAAAVVICVAVWQPWQETVYEDEIVEANNEYAESIEESDGTPSNSDLADETVVESYSVEACAESENDSEYKDGIIYDEEGIEESATTGTGAASEDMTAEEIEDEAKAETECEAETNVFDTSENTEYEPVVFTDSSDRQFTLTCTGISDSEISFIVRNDSEDTLMYGHYRRLYIENDGVWEEIECREYEDFVIVFDAGLYSLEPGEEFTEEISIDFLWGSLEPGHYKVSLDEFYFHWQDHVLVEYEFYYGDEEEQESTEYPNGQIQEIYAYYGGALYYDNLSTTSILPEDAAYVGEAVITTELPDSDLEVSCMPDGTEIYYSEEKDKIYLTTDGEKYRILNLAADF